MANITKARRTITNGWQFSLDLSQRFEHLLECSGLIHTDVDCAHFDLRCFYCLHQHIHQVFDIDKIPGLSMSPKIVMGRPFCARSLKMLITPEYGDEGS